MLRTWPRVRRVVASSKWLAGVILAAVPIIYGIICIHRGHATLLGRRAASLDVSGKAGFWLAVSYIAVGSFLHFHYFWGLSERLWRFSQAGKFTSGARLFAELPLRSLSLFFLTHSTNSPKPPNNTCRLYLNCFSCDSP